jgi:hypothetical protein
MRWHDKTTQGLEPDNQRNATNAAHNKQRSMTTQPDDQRNTEYGTQQTTQHDNATPPTPGDATTRQPTLTHITQSHPSRGKEGVRSRRGQAGRPQS